MTANLRELVFCQEETNYCKAATCRILATISGKGKAQQAYVCVEKSFCM